MEDIEIQVFDEFTDYKEKLGALTLRQWIFSILGAIITIPTYIYLTKEIGEELASYVVILEGAIIGFFGFVKINHLSAEKILPFWIRHTFLFNKPITYMTIEEYKELKDKKNKKGKKSKREKISQKTKIQEIKKEEIKTETVPEEKNITETTEKKGNKKQEKRKLTKEEKDLYKAKKKYGYMFKDTAKSEETKDTVVTSEEIKKEDEQEQEIKTDDSNIVNSMTPEERKALIELLNKIK